MDGGSSITLVATKLSAPTLPAQLVDRHRLDALLDAAVGDSGVRLVLVSAPAGSGKSTLVAAWLDRRGGYAWLHADSADRDPARFWGHIVAALDQLLPGIAADVDSLIPGSGTDSSALLEAIVNALAAADRSIVLVIDDYHLIDKPAIDQAILRLVELAPAGFTLLLCSRYDPSFPLSKLRVRGELAEIRARDLRFAPGEAAALLARNTEAPTRSQIEALCERTEGWAAGLVLAGLSLAATDDVDRFVAAFHGDDRLVVDYLTEELLAGMSPSTRDRMLRTSILDRFCGPLIDAVCGTTNGAAWLRDTAATNQLLISLDQTGTWYRYHHLLRDLLRVEATAVIGPGLSELHKKAGLWHRDHGRAHDAVEHYLSGHQLEAAADLIFDESKELMNRGQLRTVRGQIDRLSTNAESHAGVMLIRGWISLLSGDFIDARYCVNRSRDLHPGEEEAKTLTGLAIMLHLAEGNVAGAVEEARAVSEPSESTQAMTLGAAHMWAGDFESAAPLLSRASVLAARESYVFAEAVTPVFEAVAAIEAGDDTAARAYAMSAVETANASGIGHIAHIALAHSVLARTHLDDEAAKAAAVRGVEMARLSPERIMLGYALACGADVFCDHGLPVGERWMREARAIIDQCPDPGIVGRYVGRVEARHRLAPPMAVSPQLIEDLTEREGAVLRYLPSLLSQRDIASELYVSLNTVKTHCRAIYRKLGVGDRKAAVQAARDHHLL